MARWEDRRRRTETVERETCEGIQKDGKACGNQRYADEPKRRRSQQRCSNMPSANSPGYVPCNDPRSNNEEYCGAKNGVYSPHRVILQIRWQVVGKQEVCAEAGRCSGELKPLWRSNEGCPIQEAAFVASLPEKAEGMETSKRVPRRKVATMNSSFCHLRACKRSSRGQHR